MMCDATPFMSAFRDAMAMTPYMRRNISDGDIAIQ